jgi:hypothetical protein
VTEIVTEVRQALPSTAGRVRRFVVIAVVVAVAAVVLALISGIRPEARPLDPDDAGPRGSLAVVEVLRQHGVEVSVVRSADRLSRSDGPATLVLGNADYLGDVAAQDFRWAAGGGAGIRVVLVLPTAAALAQLGYPIRVLPGSSSDPLTARCATIPAADGDTIGPVSPRLIPPVGATSCFPYWVPADVTEGSSGYAMVTIPAKGTQPEIVAVSFGEALSNQKILEADNAGVAVRLLGGTQRLVWYQPDVTDRTPGADTIDPWPAWQWPAAWVLGLAFVVFAIAIGRRLGRLVPEPLPVVVMASETTQARARLYYRTHDLARAATILRHGTIRRLRRRLGADPPAGSSALSADPSLIAHTADATGLPPTVVAERLAGAVPTSDSDLIKLSQNLADLEEKVTRT